MSRTIFTDANLLKAYLDCRRHKRATINALKFEMNLELNLDTLLQQLQNRTYKPGKSICFVVTIPKPREIFASEFRDRVTHHLLINQVQKIWEKQIFLDDSYSCRPEKGNHYGVKRLHQYVKEFKYYGAFDIANFFGSLDKRITYELFSKVIETSNRPNWWKAEILWLSKVVIFHNSADNYTYKGDKSLLALIPPHKSLINKDKFLGMPIGNLTSQFLANVYLNELDQFATKTLKIKGYGRYVDDFVIFANSRKEIKNWREQIKDFLQRQLGLELHPKKQQIQPTSHGLPFVGYFIKPYGVTVRRNVIKTLKNKIYNWVQAGEDITTIAPSLNSYYGHLGKAKSTRLRRHLISEHLSPDLKVQLTVVGNWKYIKVRGARKLNPPVYAKRNNTISIRKKSKNFKNPKPKS